MTIDTKHFKDLLDVELTTLESELLTVGRRNPETVSGWEAVGDSEDSEETDEGDIAEDLEQFETNSALFAELETQLIAVKNALENIEEGTYGKCSVCGADIEADRLEANPSASTCKLHM